MSIDMAVPAHFERAFAGDPSTVGQARRFARTVLADLPEGVCDDALTCVSELATNATRYATGDYRVVVETGPGPRARVEVVDHGSPAGDAPEVLLGGAESGRGLWICAVLGILGRSRTAAGGWRVWVDLSHPAPHADAHPGDGSQR